MSLFFKKAKFISVKVVLEELIVGLSIEIRHEFTDIIIDKFCFAASNERRSGEIQMVNLPKLIRFG